MHYKGCWGKSHKRRQKRAASLPGYASSRRNRWPVPSSWDSCAIQMPPMRSWPRWPSNAAPPSPPQAIEQRHTPKLVDFLEKLFRGATTTLVVGTDKALAPILERFTRVTVLDSSTIKLPDELQDRFRGCGGTQDTGVAVMKLQTELDLRSGALEHVQIEQGRQTDRGTSRLQVRRGPGSLRIADLGYFVLPVFAAMAEAGEYFLSRLMSGTDVRFANVTVNILGWLAKQPGPFVDTWIQLGQKQRLPCRLIAWRLPQEQANARRRKLREE